MFSKTKIHFFKNMQCPQIRPPPNKESCTCIIWAYGHVCNLSGEDPFENARVFVSSTIPSPSWRKRTLSNATCPTFFVVPFYKPNSVNSQFSFAIQTKIQCQVSCNSCTGLSNFCGFQEIVRPFPSVGVGILEKMYSLNFSSFAGDSALTTRPFNLNRWTIECKKLSGCNVSRAGATH